MKAFPMFLTMQNRRVVIVGGAEQACQKCRLMLKTEAKITLLAPSLNAELNDLFQTGKVQWQAEPARPEDFSDTALVFIATGCEATDNAMHKIAKSAGALVNVVDQPDLCDAITPSIVDRSPVVVAIGTEGTAPVLARQIKSRMEELLEPRLGDLAALAGRLRGQAADRLGARDRRDLWRWVFAGPVRQTHARGAERQAARMIKQAIEDREFGQHDKTSVALVKVAFKAPDLVTLRAVQRLQDADVIFYDRHIDPEVLDLARRDADRVMVAETSRDQMVSHGTHVSLLVNAARQGKRVVRLTCVDQLYSYTDRLLVEALDASAIPYEIVPGVIETDRQAPNAGNVPAALVPMDKAS